MFMKLFTWWKGSTLGALFDIKRRASFVGEDDYGNRYFEDRRTSLGDRNYHRRYVIYNGLAEPSKVPADWHGWLHHTVTFRRQKCRCRVRPGKPIILQI